MEEKKKIKVLKPVIETEYEVVELELVNVGRNCCNGCFFLSNARCMIATDSRCACECNFSSIWKEVE